MFFSFLKPNPQALTSGATVMSNAPCVYPLISFARRNTWVNMLSGVTSSLRLMREITEAVLNGESEASTFRSSLSISCCRLESHW